ncbi:O-antigen ligase family protein [Porticoccus sp.]
MQELHENKLVTSLYYLLATGLFVQLAGKVLYASGSANGVHVYLLLILPMLVLVSLALFYKWRFFSSEVKRFFAAASLFMAICALSAAWSDGEETPLYVLRKSVVLLLYLAAVIYLVTVAKWQHIKWFLLTLCLVAAIGALVSLCYQLVILDEAFGWRTFRIYRMGYGKWVDLGYPVIAGIYFALFGVLAASLVALGRQTRGQNMLLILVVLALLPYVFLTFSRTSWIAWAVAIGYLMVVFRHRATIMLAAILACIALVMIAIYQNEVAVEVTKRQLSGRPQIWLWTLNSFLEHPFFGHGFAHSFWPEKVFAHAHNFFLQVLFEQGLVGVASFCLMLATVFKGVWSHRANRLVLAAFALVVYILVAMMVEVQHVITRPGLFWTIFWFPLAFTMGAVNRARLNAAESAPCAANPTPQGF